ncbi:hypothetical protein PaeCFBP13512_18475 [Paenibacillus sp. CFBP13512]|uniref:hypothetical protein n=1 Tax=Paenibacillus sp. CFBP13512 TaxID=2184007 RepID=UPI0010C05A38|nr:hypothetical protein [Paenibacillus sp. CFBP13512]TKJ87209.1 hypothetical protein PaeCFBP13512_18475 [Paenibacillus sp. CFBP13512]
MAYTSLNPSIKRKIKTNEKLNKLAAKKVDLGFRWEFIKGMHGNVFQVKDHLLMRYYRQDRETLNAGSFFDGFLPYYCDYCKTVVKEIVNIPYTLVYEYLVRAKLDNSEWIKSKTKVVYSCCAACENGPLPLSPDLIGYHVIEIYENEKLIFTQERKN